LAIKLDFYGRQPSAFGAPPARAEAYRSGDFVGDVAQGGPCNCEIYTLTPHCNATHTECVGHLCLEKIHVCDVPLPLLMSCMVVSVEAQDDGPDLYYPRRDPRDKLIHAYALQAALQRAGWQPGISALVVRTRNELFGDFSPYFSNDAMRLVRQCGFEHLLVDFSSIDKADDDGKLSNHRIFWDLPQDTTVVRAESPRTITEFVFVPPNIGDGIYALNLGVAPFMADAAPSHPVLFPKNCLPFS
jgi:kynurenine formamidase